MSNMLKMMTGIQSDQRLDSVLVPVTGSPWTSGLRGPALHPQLYQLSQTDQLFLILFTRHIDNLDNVQYKLFTLLYLHFLRSTSVIVSRIKLDSEVLCITLLSFKNFALFYTLPDHLLFVILFYQKL